MRLVKLSYVCSRFRSFCGQRGMTLIELMISVGIMAIIAAGAYQVFTNLQLTHDRLEIKTKTIDGLQRFWYLLSQDAAFLIVRPIRVTQADKFGGATDNLFEKSMLPFAGQPNLVQWSRNSGAPYLADGIPTSELRRVAYALDEDKLYRYQWRHLDTIPESRPTAQLMLENVNSLNFRFAFESFESTDVDSNSGNQPDSISWVWADQLPDLSPLSSGLPLGPQPVVPGLIEVTLDVEGFGAMKRLFQVGVPFTAKWHTMKEKSLQNIGNNGDSNTTGDDTDSQNVTNSDDKDEDDE